MPEKEPVWNLEALYQNAEDWEADFKRMRPLAEAFAAYRERLGEAPETLAAAIAARDDYSRLAEKVYSYAHLRSDENVADSTNRARVDRVMACFAGLAELESWFEPEFMRIDENRLREWLTHPALIFYRRSLEQLMREREHTLSEPEERVLGALSDVMGAPAKIFGILNDADSDFGRVTGEGGRRLELTHGSYRRLMESPQREVRRRAFRKLYSFYQGKRNTFAATLDATVRRHATMARLRRYPSALAAALAPDNVPEKVYRNLIDSVHSGLSGFYRYMDLRAEVLHLDHLDMYDMYNPLLPDYRREYPFKSGAAVVREALRPLGKEYLTNLDLAFRQRWIDVPERKGKRSGAYSGGCYDSYPYVLLNYNRTLNDVFTLAHELGHSMHSFYSNSSQPYHYADYEIFVAEVASTTNEVLLFEHLLKNTDDRLERCFLYGYLADEIRGTIFRQTMFAEYELLMHETVEQGRTLDADLLSERYYELNRLYYGPRVLADRSIGLEWSRIPHFYYNFYVYKYATGMSAALQLAERLLSGDDDARRAYFGFLRAGGSKDVLDIMRDAGVDLSTPEPIKAALAYFDRLIDRLRAELNS